MSGKAATIVVVPRPDSGETTHLTLKRGLRLLFGDERTPHVAHHPDGAPYFPDRPDLLYSSSDCRSCVALQVATTETDAVGIDVEDKAEQADRVLFRYADARDLEVMRRYPEVSPLHLWCGKEAVYKAYGHTVRDFRRDITLEAPGQFYLPQIGLVRVSYSTGDSLSLRSRSGYRFPSPLLLAFLTDRCTEETLLVL